MFVVAEKANSAGDEPAGMGKIHTSRAAPWYKKSSALWVARGSKLGPIIQVPGLALAHHVQLVQVWL